MRTGAIVMTLGFALAACSREKAIDQESLEPDVVALHPGDEVKAMTPPSAPLFVGVWAAKQDWCSIAPGSGDPAPIAITANEFIGYENRCAIARIEEGTEAGWRLTMTCNAEGVETTETMDLDIDGDKLRVRPGDAPEMILVKCN